MSRLLVARLWHEGSSFAPRATVLDDFVRSEWLRGDEALGFHRGGVGELAAAVAHAAAHPGDAVRFSRCAAAAPGGPLAAGLFEQVRDEIVADVAAFRPDAIYLSLHGALLAHGVDAPDLQLLRAVRAAAGAGVVIGVSLDLHANLPADAAALVQVAVAYATYPHVDMRATGARVLALVEAARRGRIAPRCALVPLQRLLPSHAMRTDPAEGGPMAEVQARLRAWEQADPRVLALSALAGFAYADVAHAGAAGLACIDMAGCASDDDEPLRWAARVKDELAQRDERFHPVLPGPADGLAQACALIAEGRRPVAVLDPADNPLSGGAADTTALLQALLAQPLPGDTVFALFHDSELVARAQAAGLGAEIDVALGGRWLPAFGTPVNLRLRVARLTDGRFVNEGPMWTGQACAQGPSVVLQDPSRPLRIVVASRCETPNDPAWFALHGIEVATLALLCVKAKNHFRAAFGQRFAALIDVDAPGPAGLDLAALPFTQVPLARRQRLPP